MNHKDPLSIGFFISRKLGEKDEEDGTSDGNLLEGAKPPGEASLCNLG